MTWVKSPAEKYGGALAVKGPVAQETEAQGKAAPVELPKAAGLLSPDHPMFWFGVITAGGVALMAYSTYVPVVG